MNATSRTRALFYLVAVFLVGAVTGWLFGYASGRRSQFAPPHPGDMADHVMSRFQRDLRLTPDQVRQIRPLVDQTSSNLNQLQVGAMSQGEQLIRHCDDQIRELLTPEQRATFERLQAYHERRKPRGHGPPPPGTNWPEPGKPPGAH